MNKIATGMGRKPKNEAQNHSESALYNIVSMLVLTGDIQKVSETFSQKYHLSEKETANLVRLAREKINLASEIEKKEELGKRIIQLDELYERLLKTGRFRNSVGSIFLRGIPVMKRSKRRLSAWNRKGRFRKGF